MRGPKALPAGGISGPTSVAVVHLISCFLSISANMFSQSIRLIIETLRSLTNSKVTPSKKLGRLPSTRYLSQRDGGVNFPFLGKIEPLATHHLLFYKNPSGGKARAFLQFSPFCSVAFSSPYTQLFFINPVCRRLLFFYIKQEC